MAPDTDLAFFVALCQHSSLAAAAQHMGLTPPAVSRRLAALEGRLGVRLLNRTTRRQSLTPEGERYLQEGRRILLDLQHLEQDLVASRHNPAGIMRINAGFGFGRRHLAAALAEFVRLYPQIEATLHLTDRPLDLAEHAMDVGIRFGLGQDSGVLARKIAGNRRILCASPAYLDKHGIPNVPADLPHHACLGIHENHHPFNTWHLVNGKQTATVKIHGPLATNHGEVAVQWALEGHGIVLRSEWDIAAHLRAKELRHVMADWSGVAADIYAVYPQRDLMSAKVRLFLDFLSHRFAAYKKDGMW